LRRELDAIVAAACDAYSHSRKAPVTRKAGPGFADPVDRSSHFPPTMHKGSLLTFVLDDV